MKRILLIVVALSSVALMFGCGSSEEMGAHGKSEQKSVEAKLAGAPPPPDMAATPAANSSSPMTGMMDSEGYQKAKEQTEQKEQKK